MPKIQDQSLSTVQIELGDETYDFRLCLWGFRVAENQGYDIGQVPADEEEAEEAIQQAEEKGTFDAIIETLWLARLPFEEDLTLRQMGMAVELGDLEPVMEGFRKIHRLQMDASMQEKVEEARGDKKKDPSDP